MDLNVDSVPHCAMYMLCMLHYRMFHQPDFCKLMSSSPVTLHSSSLWKYIIAPFQMGYINLPTVEIPFLKLCIWCKHIHSTIVWEMDVEANVSNAINDIFLKICQNLSLCHRDYVIRLVTNDKHLIYFADFSWKPNPLTRYSTQDSSQCLCICIL